MFEHIEPPVWYIVAKVRFITSSFEMFVRDNTKNMALSEKDYELYVQASEQEDFDTIQHLMKKPMIFTKPLWLLRIKFFVQELKAYYAIIFGR